MCQFGGFCFGFEPVCHLANMQARLLWVSKQKQSMTVFVTRSRPSNEYRLLSVPKKSRRLCDSTGGVAEDVAGSNPVIPTKNHQTDLCVSLVVFDLDSNPFVILRTCKHAFSQQEKTPLLRLGEGRFMDTNQRISNSSSSSESDSRWI